MFNVWLGIDGIIKAIIRDANEPVDASVMCGLEQVV
jgi:hypothetical protein